MEGKVCSCSSTLAAKRQLHLSAKVLCFSELDQIALYLDSKQGFYFNDDARPDLVSIYPDYGGKLRQKVVDKIDWHAERSYRPAYYTEVVALHGTKAIPLYVEKRIIRDRNTPSPAVLVEGAARPIWVLGPQPDDLNGKGELHMVCRVTVNSIAYWLWQLTSSIDSIIRAIPHPGHNPVETSFDGDFTLRRDVAASSDTTPVQVDVSPHSARVLVKIDSSFMDLIDADDNSGERELMGKVLEGLRLLLAPQERSLLSDRNHCPIIRPPCSARSQEDDPAAQCGDRPRTLDPTGLPDLRLVQEADENEVLDELGEHLSKTLSLSIGVIPSNQRNNVLHECVGFHFKRSGIRIKSRSVRLA